MAEQGESGNVPRDAMTVSDALREAFLRRGDRALAGIGRETYMLVCQHCHFEEPVTVAHMTDLYAAMNARRWTLIPSQHGARVRGLCRACWPLALVA